MIIRHFGRCSFKGVALRFFKDKALALKAVLQCRDRERDKDHRGDHCAAHQFELASRRPPPETEQKQKHNSNRSKGHGPARSTACNGQQACGNSGIEYLAFLAFQNGRDQGQQGKLYQHAKHVLVRHSARCLNHSAKLLLDDKTCLYNQAKRQPHQQMPQCAWPGQFARNSHENEQHSAHLKQGECRGHRVHRHRN